jgi:hypothetical protein
METTRAIVFTCIPESITKKELSFWERDVMTRSPRILRITDHQVGRSNIPIDRDLPAMPPGLRKSVTGKFYWETRKNRSDLRGRI